MASKGRSLRRCVRALTTPAAAAPPTDASLELPTERTKPRKERANNAKIRAAEALVERQLHLEKFWALSDMESSNEWENYVGGLGSGKERKAALLRIKYLSTAMGRSAWHMVVSHASAMLKAHPRLACFASPSLSNAVACHNDASLHTMTYHRTEEEPLTDADVSLHLDIPEHIAAILEAAFPALYSIPSITHLRGTTRNDVAYMQRQRTEKWHAAAPVLVEWLRGAHPTATFGGRLAALEKDCLGMKVFKVDGTLLHVHVLAKLHQVYNTMCAVERQIYEGNEIVDYPDTELDVTAVLHSVLNGVILGGSAEVTFIDVEARAAALKKELTDCFWLGETPYPAFPASPLRSVEMEDLAEAAAPKRPDKPKLFYVTPDVSPRDDLFSVHTIRIGPGDDSRPAEVMKELSKHFPATVREDRDPENPRKVFPDSATDQMVGGLPDTVSDTYLFLEALWKHAIHYKRSVPVPVYLKKRDYGGASEDETLLCITEEACKRAVGRLMGQASKGLAVTNNYNKTSNSVVRTNEQSREAFTAKLPLVFDFDSTKTQYLAVVSLLVEEACADLSWYPGGTKGVIDALDTPHEDDAAFLIFLVNRQEAARAYFTSLCEYHAGVRTMPPDASSSSSIVLSVIDGSCRLMSTSEAGAETLQHHLLYRGLRELLKRTDGVEFDLHAALTHCREKLHESTVGAIEKNAKKWTVPLVHALLVKREVSAQIIEQNAHVEGVGPSQCEVNLASHIQNATTWLDQKLVSDLPPAGVIFGATLREAHATSMMGDRFIPVRTSVNSFAKLLFKTEQSHWQEMLFYPTEMKDAPREVEGRHLQTAGVLVQLFSGIRVDGVLPMRQQLITVTKDTNKNQSRSLAVLRVDVSVLDVASFASGVVAQSQYPPMIVPPRSWSQSSARRYDASPYKLLSATLLRPNSDTSWLTKQVLDTVHPALVSAPLVTSLDFMGAVGWAVSRIALAHLTWLKATGVDFGDKLRGGWVSLPTPPPRFRTRRSMELHQVELEESGVKTTQRTTALSGSSSILTILNRFKDDTLYLPVNGDFRGRTYPLHSVLNYQASDFVRCSLEFAERKPVGPNGLVHIKIHAANLMGLDKQSFTNRIKWCDDNEDRIKAMVENPYAEDAVWRKADKPLLGFVVLMELGKALSHSQGPEHYETGMPIHVDGSCNGLQHYSALTLDRVGARTANLGRNTWDDKPSDIYSTVLEVVKEKNDSLIAGGGPKAEIALSLKPYLIRKTVKQSVMTNVYGVTFMGMREQIRGQIVALTENNVEPLTRNQITSISTHCALLINNSLTSVFRGAIDTQNWFKVYVHPQKPVFFFFFFFFCPQASVLDTVCLF